MGDDLEADFAGDMVLVATAVALGNGEAAALALDLAFDGEGTASWSPLAPSSPSSSSSLATTCFLRGHARARNTQIQII
jgi:hypothetical protein